MKYFSQFKQDEFLNKVVFSNKKNGFFIDIGAHDGISLSNTYFFELTKRWDGICFEPNPSVFVRLDQNRNCLRYNVCIGDHDGEVVFCQISGYAEMLSGIKKFYNEEHLKRINIETKNNGGNLVEINVKIKRLNSFPELKDRQIDYLSIDTEGNELSILKSIDFEKLNIKAISIENNYKEVEIFTFMKNNGFDFITKLNCDEIYVKSNFNDLGLKMRFFLWRVNSKFNSFLIRFKR